MYKLKYFETLLPYEKREKDVIALDFPKTKNNYLFIIKVDKSSLKVEIEDEFGANAPETILKVLQETKPIFSEFLTNEFGEHEVSIIGLYDGKKYYVVDVIFNEHYFVQEDIDEFAEKYKFNTLNTIYKGAFDEEKMKALNRNILIKSRLENDFFDGYNKNKERFAIYWGMKDGNK